MMDTISLFEQLATEAARMRIAAFPAKIARSADADGFNEAFVLHWRKCFSIRSRSKQVRTAARAPPNKNTLKVQIGANALSVPDGSPPPSRPLATKSAFGK